MERPNSEQTGTEAPAESFPEHLIALCIVLHLSSAALVFSSSKESARQHLEKGG
jgi:hypothetical protein